ncbi:MAG: DUF4340 domain-containing protein [Planctomycetota bacterium]|nr:DUF4340 domain-containing protein [Planctomycetota bacterium]
MSEQGKTILFLCVAVVSTLVAFAVSREAPEKTAADQIGQPLVAIEDPLEVARLRIVNFNADEGAPAPFEIAKVDGRFSIPSHENHPADQSDHLVDAVTGVNYAEILASVTDQAGNHEDFGVVDPTAAELGRGAKGVGKRVTFHSAKGDPLADFIIGKKVIGSEDQYYVRQASNDQVYTVKLDPTSLSTRFEDWIERDVLQFDPLELKDVAISDYTVVTGQQPILGAEGLRVATVVQGLEMEAEIVLEYDQTDLEWNLEKLIAFENGKPTEEGLSDDQQLNKKRLEEMKVALDDLRVVNVRRKPDGLGNSLAEFIQSSPGAVESLEQHGYFFRQVEGPGGTVQNVLLSNHGEVNIGMADGLKYVLRFGGIAGREKADGASGLQQDQASSAVEETVSAAEDSAATGRALRYLMVTTEFDPSLLTAPEYADVPPEQPPQEKAAEDAVAEDTVAGDTAAGELREKTAEKPADGTTASGPAETPEADAEQWTRQREAILAENAKKKQSFADKIETGKQRSAELNRRFANWYYVIADSTYQKIHLTLKDLIEKKPPSPATGAASDLPPTGQDPLNQLRNIVPPQE